MLIGVNKKFYLSNGKDERKTRGREEEEEEEEDAGLCKCCAEQN